MADKDLENLPSELKYCYQKALTAFEKKDFDYAIQISTQALDLKFDFKEARFILHMCKREKAGSAKTGFIKTALNTLKDTVFYIQALVSRFDGAPERQIEKYEKLLTHEPNNKHILHLMAAVFMKNSLQEPARFIFEEIYAIDPKDVIALRNLGKLYYKKGLIEKSRSMYKKLLGLKSNDFEAEKALKDLDALKTIEQSFKDKDTGSFEIRTDL